MINGKKVNAKQQSILDKYFSTSSSSSSRLNSLRQNTNNSLLGSEQRPSTFVKQSEDDSIKMVVGSKRSRILHEIEKQHSLVEKAKKKRKLGYTSEFHIQEKEKKKSQANLRKAMDHIHDFSGINDELDTSLLDQITPDDLYEDIESSLMVDTSHRDLLKHVDPSIVNQAQKKVYDAIRKIRTKGNLSAHGNVFYYGGNHDDLSSPCEEYIPENTRFSFTDGDFNEIRRLCKFSGDRTLVAIKEEQIDIIKDSSFYSMSCNEEYDILYDYEPYLPKDMRLTRRQWISRIMKENHVFQYERPPIKKGNHRVTFNDGAEIYNDSRSMSSSFKTLGYDDRNDPLYFLFLCYPQCIIENIFRLSDITTTTVFDKNCSLSYRSNLFTEAKNSNESTNTTDSVRITEDEPISSSINIQHYTKENIKHSDKNIRKRPHNLPHNVHQPKTPEYHFMSNHQKILVNKHCLRNLYLFTKQSSHHRPSISSSNHTTRQQKKVTSLSACKINKSSNRFLSPKLSQMFPTISKENPQYESYKQCHQDHEYKEEPSLYSDNDNLYPQSPILLPSNFVRTKTEWIMYFKEKGAVLFEIEEYSMNNEKLDANSLRTNRFHNNCSFIFNDSDDDDDGGDDDLDTYDDDDDDDGIGKDSSIIETSYSYTSLKKKSIPSKNLPFISTPLSATTNQLESKMNCGNFIFMILYCTNWCFLMCILKSRVNNHSEKRSKNTNRRYYSDKKDGTLLWEMVQCYFLPSMKMNTLLR